MATGTPIRLVREDGGLISLNATQIALSTEREFGPNSMPFACSQRLPLDLNINNEDIVYHDPRKELFQSLLQKWKRKSHFERRWTDDTNRMLEVLR